MDPVLLILVAVLAVGLIWVFLARRRGPALDDQCALDRLPGKRPPVRASMDALPEAPREEVPAVEGRIDPALLPSLRKLSSAMPDVVAEGARELGESGNAEAAGPLLAALQQRHRSVTFAAVGALLRLGAPCVTPVRERLENERDDDLRGLLARLLEQLVRKGAGQEPAPVEEIVGMSNKVRDEIAEGWAAR